MKNKIIIIFFLLSKFVGVTQPVINRTFGTNTVNDPRLSATLNLLVPRYNDTTAANSNIGVDSCSALIFTYSDNSYWMRACSPSKHWVKILKTGDVSNATWGSITGTLSNQTDLQNALNLKFNISDTTNKWVQNVYTRNDSLFKFKNGDETFIDTLGNGGKSLQDVMNVGNTTQSTYIFDSAATATDGNPVGKVFFKVRPLDRTGNPPDLQFSLGATKFTGVSRRDNVFHFGWGINSGGGQETVGEVGIGESWEHTYIPAVGDTIDAEKHEFYITRAGLQKRLGSYTIRENIGFYDFYHTVSRAYLKLPTNDRVYYSTQPSNVGASSTWALSESKNFSIIYDSTIGATFNLGGAVSGGTRTASFTGFDAALLPTMQLGPSEIRVTDGATLRSENNNTTNLGDASRRWSTVWGVDGNYSGTLRGVTKLWAGSSGVDYSAALLNLTKNDNSGSVASIENASTGTGAYEQVILSESISGGNFADFVRFNNTTTGNYAGTSIPYAGLAYISNSTSHTYVNPLLLNAGSIIGVTGSGSTTIGYRQDGVGFRIAPKSTLHTTNTNEFQIRNVGMTSYTSGSSANDALKIIGNSDGAIIGKQNLNASGFVGDEYFDNTGALKVFTGFNNSNGQEFRFNNLASGGYIAFITGSTVKFTINNSGGATFNTSTNSYTMPSTRATAGQVLTDEIGNGILSWATLASATTFYTGDGTIAGNRSVNANNLNITFSDVNTFRINMDVFALSRADGAFPYSNVVVAPAQQLWVAYTPTVGNYSKGAAMIIDTNNNVSLGSGVMPSTAPLYTAGSAFIQGFQSSQGNFYKVTDITADQTLNTTHYWINVDATGGNVVVTLPAASSAFGANMGIQYVIRRVDNSGNTVTVQRAGSDTINGATSFTLAAQYAVEELQCVSTSAWALKQP